MAAAAAASAARQQGCPAERLCACQASRQGWPTHLPWRAGLRLLLPRAQPFQADCWPNRGRSRCRAELHAGARQARRQSQTVPLLLLLQLLHLLVPDGLLALHGPDLVAGRRWTSFGV